MTFYHFFVNHDVCHNKNNPCLRKAVILVVMQIRSRQHTRTSPIDQGKPYTEMVFNIMEIQTGFLLKSRKRQELPPYVALLSSDIWCIKTGQAKAH
jgi:hypothetical protein